MVIVASIYAENLELVRAKPDLSWKERIKDFCLYQHQEGTETLLPAETFSIHSPTLRSFLCSAPVLLCPLQRGRPTKTPESVSCSSCARIFSFTAPGSYYTTTHFLCLFYSSLSFRVKAHATASDHSWLCLATHIALPEQSLCYCKALSHDSLRKSQCTLCRRVSPLFSEAQVQTEGCTCVSHGGTALDLQPKAQEVSLTNHFRLP